jgi:hypothetical protein
MATFAKPPTTSNFEIKGQPAPSWAWERWFVAISDFLTAPQIKRYTPPNSTSTGVADSITYDSSYLYICVTTNTWKRIPLNTF